MTDLIPTETTRSGIVDGPRRSNKRGIGSTETAYIPSGENPLLFPNGQNASEYLAHLLGIESITDGLSIERSQLLQAEIEPETAWDILRPLVVDLFAGSFGWSEGFISEGYRSIGFDLEHHDYHGHVPAFCHLILADVRSLRGSWFRNAAVIVASPPCQAYSYRAMPWKRAKALPPPDNTLFNECFRIQHEASEAAGHYIPLIVENVRGAQPWVGRARWNYGSFYLWGDVPALMPMLKGARKHDGSGWTEKGSLVSHNRLVSNQSGRKVGKDWFGGYGGGFGWDCSPMRRGSSKGKARKAASALIAKIPFPLSQHIARCYAVQPRPMESQ